MPRQKSTNYLEPDSLSYNFNGVTSISSIVIVAAFRSRDVRIFLLCLQLFSGRGMTTRVGAGRYDKIKIIKIYIYMKIYIQISFGKNVFRISQKKQKTTKNSFSKKQRNT